MSVLIIGGSTSKISKSEILLNHVEAKLTDLSIEVDRVNPSDFDPGDLINYNFANDTIQNFQRRVANATVVIIATPIYQASYSGTLKLLLDLIPQRGLTGKTVLPLATAGSLNHMLALDYALNPVLSALGASRLLPIVFLTDDAFVRASDGVFRLESIINQRIDTAIKELFRPVQTLTASAATKKQKNPEQKGELSTLAIT